MPSKTPTLVDYRLLQSSPAWQQVLAWACSGVDQSRPCLGDEAHPVVQSASEVALWRLAILSELESIGRYIDRQINSLEKEQDSERGDAQID